MIPAYRGEVPDPAVRLDTVLRAGDIIQTFAPGDYEMLRGRGELDSWLCTTFPLGFKLGGGTEWLPRGIDAEPWSTWQEDLSR